jgi:hypothetical protein
MYILILKDYCDDYDDKECSLRTPLCFLKNKHLIERLFEIIIDEADDFINNHYDKEEREERKKQLYEIEKLNIKNEEQIKKIQNLCLKGYYVDYKFDYEIFNIKL